MKVVQLSDEDLRRLASRALAAKAAAVAFQEAVSQLMSGVFLDKLDDIPPSPPDWPEQLLQLVELHVEASRHLDMEHLTDPAKSSLAKAVVDDDLSLMSRLTSGKAAMPICEEPTI